MNKILLLIIIIYVVWNAIVFILYGIDKYRSRRERRRFSEKTLITAAFLMGGIGAAVGIKAFRHKTKHVKFKVFVSFALIVNFAVIAATVYTVLY